MRKKNLLVIFSLLLLNLSLVAQEQKEVVLKTEASEVTVFINGAQILRKKSIDILPSGKSKIRFSGLSPYIDAKSVQVKIDNEVMIVSVNHQTNYLDSLPIAAKSKVIEKQLSDLSNKIATEKTNREVIKEELDFLNQNKKIGGANNGVSLLSLKETANYYRERLTALKIKDNEALTRIGDLEEERQTILNQIKEDGNLKPSPIGEVVIEVESAKATRANIELTYYVRNAGWYPTYDIRAINIEKPIELIYKANIRQNTKEDWKNVRLKVSSADPNLGNIVPQLKTYFLDYYTQAPRYDTQIDNNKVQGAVYDASTNEPLIGVSINVKGSTIGTASDMDGRFSLALPRSGNELTFSYVGYTSQTLPITTSVMNVYMREDNRNLEEIVAVGYTSKMKSVASAEDALQGRVAGIAIQRDKVETRKDTPLPTAQIENQTAIEFEIKIPYTIKSDNKNTTIEVDRYQLPAQYEYYCIPKVNKEAFLLANIVDWEKYNLLEGEANIFFENTYIGKTVLDLRNVSDTLNISLGRDKNVQVNREKVKDFNTKKFLGTKKEDTRVWKTTVKNNKSQPVSIAILDQIPISTSQEIEVEAENLSGGILNTGTGEVKWKLELQPTERKELELKYKVKYPKNRTLTIE